MSNASEIVPASADTGGKEAEVSSRPNPVALETPITVTGARPGGTAGSRDLFSEETQTVLVFKDGAVIRLAAAVAVGQLLFLTLKKTNQEVVCQVLRKRNYKPTVCYVELQFTEEKPDFWGVVFPESQRKDEEFKLAEHVQTAETTEDDQGAQVAPHNPEDIVVLKKDVETLRLQQAEADKKKAKPEETETGEWSIDPAQGKRVGGEEKKESLWDAPQSVATQLPVLPVPGTDAEPKDAAKAAEPPPVTFSKDKLELAPVNDPSPAPSGRDLGSTKGPASSENKDIQSPKLNVEAEWKKPQDRPSETKAGPPTAAETPLMPAAKDQEAVGRPVIGMALPNRGGADARAGTKDPVEELLPKPELDFSKMPQSAIYLDENDPRSIYRQRWMLPPKLRMIGLIAVAVLGLSLLVWGAWYGRVWRHLPSWRRGPAPVKVDTAKSEGAEKPTGASVVPTTPNAEAGKEAVEHPAKENTAVNRSAGGANGRGESTPKKAVEIGAPLVAKKGATKAPKNGENAASKAGEVKATEAAALDAPVIPPKLLKAASPVYPPDAMLNYITGDVRAEAVVETNGSVGEVRVLSGPKPLRDAAVEALKKYQYEPATQGGKAVVSKVTVTVKFWFDP